MAIKEAKRNEQGDIQEAGKSKAESLIDKFKQLKGGRSNFESYWQTLHDYFYVEAQDINKSYYPGTELDSTYLYDGTTLETADVLASGFMNYLTPPTSKWFRLRAKSPELTENKAVSDYLEGVTEEVYLALNRSNFYHQIISGYKSSGVYGTACLLEEEDLTDDIRFYNMPIKQICIAEDAAGRVVEHYIEFEYTAFQAATRWGVESLATEMQAEVKKRNPDKKYPFLLYIGKRHIREIQKFNKQNMPIQAVWVDKKTKR